MPLDKKDAATPPQQRSFARSMTVALVVLLMVGCGSQDSEPKTSLFEDDHVVAEHWPADLSDVAAKLRERLASPEVNEQAQKEIEDLVSWTAEIAADTNLSEADWLPLYHHSESLMANLEKAKQGLSSDDRSQIQSFCKLIDDTVLVIPDQLARQKGTSP
ncbi:hypothetical protein FF011L_04430 [Roseimaritima multifibrata]|uniref:Uncharacterized protein n=1 Tax=Roseimaritima multifibrata TaxID=1930274 RepID=A0A517M9Z4_9BACT|nr:hypothetical protein [Roseimaritima multifibrata]QDS91710.1 hypothetical protein FF011L_04430 [Roseimaritima multifibrata]